MSAEFTARPDAPVLLPYDANWGIDGTEEVYDGIGTHALDERQEVLQFPVCQSLIGMAPVIREGGVSVHMATDL